MLFRSYQIGPNDREVRYSGTKNGQTRIRKTFCNLLALACYCQVNPLVAEKTAHLVIGEDGRLDGQGEVETADIAGSFDGTLVVRGRLLIRATGRVKGDIRFGELEIERGGQLAGDVDAHHRGPKLATVAAAGDN